MEDNYDPYLDDDPRAPDQRTPPPSPPPRQGGEPDQPGVAEDTGVAEGDLAQVELRRGGSNMDPKRALTMPELLKQLEMVRAVGAEKQDIEYLVKYPAMMLWQYHSIDQIGDGVHCRMANLMGHPQFSFALKTEDQRLKSGKACPPKLLLGSGNR